MVRAEESDVPPRIWIASVLSATFLSAQDVTATWLLHDLGASFSLSLMATATSTPLLLFALPAGIIADTTNRRNVILSAMAWQSAFTGLLAARRMDEDARYQFDPSMRFCARNWYCLRCSSLECDCSQHCQQRGASIGGDAGWRPGEHRRNRRTRSRRFCPPDTRSAAPHLDQRVSFSRSASFFFDGGPPRCHANRQSRASSESFLGSLRYAARSHPIKDNPLPEPPLFTGNFRRACAPSGDHIYRIEGLGCPAWPSLYLRGRRIVSSEHSFALPYLRRANLPERHHLGCHGHNARCAYGDGIAAHLIQPAGLLDCIAGVAWAVAGTELWLAAQRAVSGTIRGRMNSFLMMAGQAGIALGSILIASGSSQAGLIGPWLLQRLSLLLVSVSLSLFNQLPREGATEQTPSPTEEPDALGYYIHSLCRTAGYSNASGRLRAESKEKKQRSLRKTLSRSF